MENIIMKMVIIIFGQCKNDLCHGKGTLYAPDGRIRYEGEFKKW